MLKSFGQRSSFAIQYLHGVAQTVMNYVHRNNHIEHVVVLQSQQHAHLFRGEMDVIRWIGERQDKLPGLALKSFQLTTLKPAFDMSLNPIEIEKTPTLC